MITVQDLAFELWFSESGAVSAEKPVWRREIFDRMIAAGKPSPGMDRAFKYAVIVLGLAGEGAFTHSPVGFVSSDGLVH